MATPYFGRYTNWICFLAKWNSHKRQTSTLGLTHLGLDPKDCEWRPWPNSLVKGDRWWFHLNRLPYLKGNVKSWCMLMSSIFDIAWTYQYPNPQTFSKVRCQCCELRRWYHGVIAMESCRFTVPIGPRHSCTSPRLQTSAAVQRVTNSCCHQNKYIYIYLLQPRDQR